MTDVETLARGLTEVRNELVALRATGAAKPDTATIYQAVLACFAGMFAVMVGTVILLKAIGTIPA